MDKLNEVQIFKTGSTIANGGQLTDAFVNKYKTAIDGLNLSQAQAALSTTALNEAQQKQILTAAGLITSADSVTAAEVKQAVSENVLTTAKQQEVLAVFEQQIAEGQLSVERLQAIALENTEAGAVARVILAKKGENAQNLKNIASGKALNTVLKEQFLLLLKNPLTWVAVAVVGVVALTKAIENSIVTEEKLNEEIEELNSNWSELSSTIQNSAQSFQSLKKSADELIPRYAELAQGVDKYGNNVSLTDEEFEEFVSLNNQLGQMFPELVMGYDSNGNAILSLSGNVNTLTESLYSLVEAQRLASAQTIADTMPDVMSNIDSTVEAYNSKIQLIEDEKKSLEDLYNTFKNGGFVEEWSSVGESMVSAVKILDKYGIDYNSEITGERNGVVGSTRYKITVDWDDFETAYNGKIAGFEKQTNDIIGRIESKWKQLNPVVSAWLSTDYLYQDLESNGQSLVTAMVGAIDFKSLGLTTEQEVQNYISNSIISPIYDMDTATQNAFFKIFDLHEALDNGELSVQEYQKEVNEILENGNYSQEFVTIFRMAFAEDDVQTKYNEAVTKFGTDSKDTLEKFFTDNSINTEEEIDYFNKVTEGAKTASEAIEMYNKVKSDTFNNKTTISFRELEKINEEIDNIQKSYQSVQSAFEDYAETGAFSVDSFQALMEISPKHLQYLMDEKGQLNLNTEALNEYTNSLIDEAAQRQINTIIDYVTKLDSEAQAQYFLKTATDKSSESLETFATNLLKAKIAAGELSAETAQNLATMLNGVVSWANKAKEGVRKNGLSSSTKDTEKTIKDIHEQLEDLDKKEKLDNLQNSINKTDLYLSSMKNTLDSIEESVDNLFENDFANRMELISEQFKIGTELGKAYREEFERLAKVQPMSADEANELANRLETLGSSIRENAHNLVEYTKQMNELRVSSITTFANNSVDQLSKELSLIENNIKALNEGSVLGDSFSFDFLFPTIPESAIEKQKKENDKMIAEEKDYNDTILDIKKKALELEKEENDKARKKEREELLKSLKKTQTEIQLASQGLISIAESTTNTISDNILDAIENLGGNITDMIDEVTKHLSLLNNESSKGILNTVSTNLFSTRGLDFNYKDFLQALVKATETNNIAEMSKKTGMSSRQLEIFYEDLKDSIIKQLKENGISNIGNVELHGVGCNNIPR